MNEKISAEEKLRSAFLEQEPQELSASEFNRLITEVKSQAVMDALIGDSADPQTSGLQQDTDPSTMFNVAISLQDAVNALEGGLRNDTLDDLNSRATHLFGLLLEASTASRLADPRRELPATRGLLGWLTTERVEVSNTKRAPHPDPEITPAVEAFARVLADHEITVHAHGSVVCRCEPTKTMTVDAYTVHLAKAAARTHGSEMLATAEAAFIDYMGQWPFMRPSWGGLRDPESSGARAIATKTLIWLNTRMEPLRADAGRQ